MIVKAIFSGHKIGCSPIEKNREYTVFGCLSHKDSSKSYLIMPDPSRPVFLSAHYFECVESSEEDNWEKHETVGDSAWENQHPDPKIAIASIVGYPLLAKNKHHLEGVATGEEAEIFRFYEETKVLDIR